MIINLIRVRIPFSLVPLIPYSAITKRILVRSLILHIFTRVENQFKKTKTTHYFLILKTFSHSLSYKRDFLFYKNNVIFFLIIIPIRFSAIQNRTKITLRGIHLMKCCISKLFGNRRNNWVIFTSSSYTLLTKVGSTLQDIIQVCIFIKQNIFP